MNGVHAKLINSHGSSNSRGVAIMIKNNLDCTIHHTVLAIDPMGRYIILKAYIIGITYLLINLYAPNKDKDLKEFFKNLLNTSKKENRLRGKYCYGRRFQLPSQSSD